MASDSFLRTLEEFASITEEIRSKLKKELQWIEGHKERCIAAKTAGTTASVAGATIIIGSLLLAPITGGASVVAAAGYGSAVALAGGAINLTTDITDMITQWVEKDDVKQICKQRNNVARRLKEHFEELQRVAKELQKLNVEVDQSYVFAFVGLVLKGRGIIQIGQCAQVAKGTYNFLLRNGGHYWGGLRGVSEFIMKPLRYFGFNVTKTGMMGVVRTGTLVFSGAFAIYDVYSLINYVKNEHPSAEGVSEIISQLDEELEEINEMINAAHKIR